MSDPATTPPLPPPPVPPAGGGLDAGALIFDWSPVRWRRTRLLFFLGLAVGGHVLLFYLFKVVAPPAPRTVPPARSALILSPSFAPSAALLENSRWQYPALFPPIPLTEPDAGELRKLVKGYQPTWERQTARLKPLPAEIAGGALPSIIPFPALLLPPLPPTESPAGTRPLPPLAAAPPSPSSPAPASPPALASGGQNTANPQSPAAVAPAAATGAPPSPAATSPVTAAVAAAASASGEFSPVLPRPLPVLSVQSGLGGRALLKAPVWPAEVTQPDWPEEGPASFMISVSAEGKVLSCLPLSTVSFDIEVLRQPLLAARFAARTDSDDTAWAWVDVQW